MSGADAPRTRRGPARPPGGTAPGLDGGLLKLRLRSFWAALKKEPASFWLLCFYFFVEYVRLQTIHSALDVIPWGQTALALTLGAYFLEGAPTRRFHVLDGLLLVFTLFWGVSIGLAVYPEWSFEGAHVFINWLLVYFLVTHIVTTKHRLMIFLSFFFLWSLKLSQFGARSFIQRGFGFASWGIKGPQGWFENSGELGIQMCIFFAMSLLCLLGLKDHLDRKKFWILMALLPGTAALSIIATSSRGSQLALAAMLALVVLKEGGRHRVKAVVAGAAVISVLWGVVPAEQRERFAEMGDDESSVARLTYWSDGIEIANQFPVSGIGYDNWLPYYRRHYNPTGEVPHNIFVEAAAELGYPGLLSFLILAAGLFYMNHRSRKWAAAVPKWGPFLAATASGLDVAVLGYLVAGMFVTVLFYPFFWVALSMTAAVAMIARKSARRGANAKAIANLVSERHMSSTTERSSGEQRPSSTPTGGCAAISWTRHL